MKSRDFVYWLQGFMEITTANDDSEVTLSSAQIKCIQNHLNMVFVHDIDPTHGDKAHQERLARAHQGLPSLSPQERQCQALGKVSGQEIDKDAIVKLNC